MRPTHKRRPQNSVTVTMPATENIDSTCFPGPVLTCQVLVLVFPQPPQSRYKISSPSQLPRGAHQNVRRTLILKHGGSELTDSQLPHHARDALRKNHKDWPMGMSRAKSSDQILSKVCPQLEGPEPEHSPKRMAHNT